MCCVFSFHGAWVGGELLFVCVRGEPFVICEQVFTMFTWICATTESGVAKLMVSFGFLGWLQCTL